MAHKRTPAALWVIEGIAALSNGERRKVKFVVLAPTETYAVSKIITMTKDYALYDHDEKVDLNWTFQLGKVKEVPFGIYCVEGIEEFEAPSD